MKLLTQTAVTNKSLKTIYHLFAGLLVTAGSFLISCNKDHLPIEITVHNGGSIQAAINSAANGTTILIEPGIYKEAVAINKPNITIIGLGFGDKLKVVIQNPGTEDNGITVRDNGDGFALKNLTISGFKENGVFLRGVDGFLLSQVVTVNNGEYGLFPVRCTNGTIVDCSATGHTDTGIYIGQSTNVQILHNEAFANVNGIEIENCSHIVADSNNSYNNVCGMLVVLLPGLQVKKSTDIILTNNLINKNNHVNFAVPGEGFESVVPSGSGILLVGVDSVAVNGNSVKGNNFVGIATVSTLVLGSLAGLPASAFSDIEPNPDYAKITSNYLAGNGAAPPAGIGLPGVDLLWDRSGINNCWRGNRYSTEYPASMPVCH